jgi:hypothetical protein
MKIILFACADSCIVDARTNRSSLIYLAEEFSANNFPAVHPYLEIFTLVQRGQNDPMKIVGKLTLSLDEQILISTNVDFDFQDKTRCRNIATIQGIVFEKPGTLRAEMRFGKVISTWSTPVTAATPPMIAAPLRGSLPGSEKAVRFAKRVTKKSAKKHAAKKR